jgi:hypothetical protein
MAEDHAAGDYDLSEAGLPVEPEHVRPVQPEVHADTPPVPLRFHPPEPAPDPEIASGFHPVGHGLNFSATSRT